MSHGTRGWLRPLDASPNCTNPQQQPAGRSCRLQPSSLCSRALAGALAVCQPPAAPTHLTSVLTTQQGVGGLASSPTLYPVHCVVYGWPVHLQRLQQWPILGRGRVKARGTAGAAQQRDCQTGALECM